MAREDERDGFVTKLHGVFVGFDDLVGVGRAQHDQARNRAKSDEVFDGLVRGAVFTYTDGIVGKDVDYRNFHDGAEADGGLAIIAKNKKCGDERANFGQREAVANGGHGMLANAEVHVAAAASFGLEIPDPIEGEAGFR